MKNIVLQIENDLKNNGQDDSGSFAGSERLLENLIASHSKALPHSQALRIREEFLGSGPIADLVENPAITEILINGPNSIFYEMCGKLKASEDTFLLLNTFRKFVYRLLEEMQTEVTLRRPFVNGIWRKHRIHIVAPSIANGDFVISFRKPKLSGWSLFELHSEKMFSPTQLQFITDAIRARKNVLVIGNTGSGKTSFMSACLSAIDPHERTIIIEDTDEIPLPNSCSVKLLTRQDQNELLPAIEASELIKQSLRMRPDRIIIGEIRGGEAKDFLLALSTGHHGSWCSLHANNPREALIRLEFLVQMGVPQWSSDVIRKLIQLSIDYIITVQRDSHSGHRKVISIEKIGTFENGSITTESIDSLAVAES